MRLLPTVAVIAAVSTAALAHPAAGQAASKGRPAGRAGAAGAAAAAAAMPPRAVLLEDVERSRGNVLKYLDAAPDSMMGFRPMAGVRTFAQQIEHAAGANAFILGQSLKIRPQLSRPDTAAIYRDKAALRTFVNASFDEFARIVREASDAQMTQMGAFAGSTKSGWRWVATALEHTTWTLGQTVPYLRANGVTPPQYLPF
jgi:hypothetical protein